jgi:hypothetical protein
MGTVLRTVPGAIQIGSRTGTRTAFSWPITGPSSSEVTTAIASLNPKGTARLVWKVIRKPIGMGTRGAIPAAIPKPVPNSVRGVIR